MKLKQPKGIRMFKIKSMILMLVFVLASSFAYSEAMGFKDLSCQQQVRLFESVAGLAMQGVTSEQLISQLEPADRGTMRPIINDVYDMIRDYMQGRDSQNMNNMVESCQNSMIYQMMPGLHVDTENAL